MQKIKPIHLLQIGLGIDMLMHGVVRIPHLSMFVNKTSAAFGESFLPLLLVKPFLTVLPFIEALIGLLILIGGKTGRLGLVGGGFLMAVLLFGATSHQDWGTASQQVIYLIAFALALHFHDKNAAIVT